MPSKTEKGERVSRIITSLDPRSILLIRFRRLGDIILTTPAVALLKRHFPKASLTYLVEEPYRRLVEGHPDIDRVLVVPAKQSRREFIALIRSIRRERFDILLDFHGGPRAAWITLASGARVKIGHAIKNKSFLYHKTAPRRGTEAPLHSVENHAGLVQALIAQRQAFMVEVGSQAKPGASPSSMSLPNQGGASVAVDFQNTEIPPIKLPPGKPEDIAHLDALLKDFINPRSGPVHSWTPLVVLHIGAGNAFRDWGLENAIALTSRLINIPGLSVALIGSEADRAREAEITGRVSSSRLLPLAGRLNLIETRELIRRSTLFVGPDSGPMHLAAGTTTPIVAYFGPTSPDQFAPWRPGLDPAKTIILQKSMDCRPCRQHECLTGDYRCLWTITPDDVFAACRPFFVSFSGSLPLSVGRGRRKGHSRSGR